MMFERTVASLKRYGDLAELSVRLLPAFRTTLPLTGLYAVAGGTGRSAAGRKRGGRETAVIGSVGAAPGQVPVTREHPDTLAPPASPLTVPPVTERAPSAPRSPSQVTARVTQLLAAYAPTRESQLSTTLAPHVRSPLVRMAWVNNPLGVSATWMVRRPPRAAALRPSTVMLMAPFVASRRSTARYEDPFSGSVRHATV